MILESLVKDTWNLVFGLSTIVGFGGTAYLFGRYIHNDYKAMMKKKEEETIVIYDLTK